jgi:hypothetical protein
VEATSSPTPDLYEDEDTSGDEADDDDDWSFKGDSPQTPKAISEESSSDQSPSPLLESISKQLAELQKVRKNKSKKKKTSTKWSRKEENLLCTMWAEESHLYDSTVDNYRNSDLRRKALNRIAAALDRDKNDVVTHMRSLRTRMSKILHQPSGSGRDNLTKRDREIAKLCSFLKEHIGSRDTISNLTKPANDSDSDGNADVEETTPKKTEATKQSKQGQKNKDKPEANTEEKPSKKTKAKEDPNTEIFGQISSCVSDVAKAVCEKKTEESFDKHMAWAKLLALKVKEMRPITGEKFKLEVDQKAFKIMEQEHSD